MLEEHLDSRMSFFKTGERGKKECPVLAFANDPHVDNCDLLSDILQREWMTEVTILICY
jgi:hypothetical protein